MLHGIIPHAFTLKMDAKGYSEFFVALYQTTRRNIADDSSNKLMVFWLSPEQK
jgi:hypothetical protein